jgi:hypothetical protein
MVSLMRRFVVSGVLAWSLAGAVFAEAPGVRKMLDVFSRLHQASALPGSEPYKFEMTEREVNDYLEYTLKKNRRPGLEEIEVKFFDENYISTSAKVNFAEIEKWQPGTIPEVLRKALKGKKTVSVDFRVIPNGRGLALLVVEKASIDEVRLPAMLVQKMMEVLGARQPEKYDLARPLPLPFGLRTIAIDRGRARGET